MGQCRREFKLVQSLAIEELRNGMSMSDLAFCREDIDWFVLQTKTRQEKALASALSAMRIPHFLPLIKKVRFYGKRKARVEVPIYSNYLFVRGSRDDVFQADRTHRVAQIIPVFDQESLHSELKSIHLALKHDAPLDPFPYLKEGTTVEVRSGPFQGVQGRIDTKKQDDRLILSIDILGRSACLEIDASLLDPIE